MNDRKEFNALSHEVSKEYKIGLTDPCREVAKVERQAAVKKNLGKKLLMLNT